MMESEEFRGLGLLVGQKKQFEDVILSIWDFVITFFFSLHFIAKS